MLYLTMKEEQDFFFFKMLYPLKLIFIQKLFCIKKTVLHNPFIQNFLPF